VTVGDRVRRVQRYLEIIYGGSAILWSIATVLGILVAVAAFGSLIELSPIVEGAARSIAVVSGLMVFAILAWRARLAWSFERVALWIEEHAPHLRYALVTAVDSRFASSMESVVQPVVANLDTAAFVRRAAARSVLPALIALLVAVAGYAMVPAEWKERLNAPVIFGGKGARAAVVGNRLVPLSGQITPPAYTGRRSIQLTEPSTITGLQGSRVVLTGRGSPSGVRASLTPTGGKGRDIPVQSDENGWRLSFTMLDTIPALLRLSDRNYTRLIITDSRVDESPVASLRLPVHDTTLRVVSGNLQLAADVNDEIGLSRARFEFIVSAGSDETFTFREGVLAEKTFVGDKRGRISISVPFATFKLEQGDRLSVRAVVWDNNTLTGPGKGISETRTIRVARKGEYDTVSINRAPGGVDTTMISLRMLIIATEKLEANRPKMERPAFVAEARKLGGQSEAIRLKIQQIINDVTGGGQIAPDTLLVTALNAMWEATRELYIASPATALPPMHVAYKALQALRNTKRYYIRGLVRPIIVNVERVRLTGVTDTGTAIPRMPRAAARSSIDQLREAYSQAVRLLRVSPDSAIEALTMVRVMSLRVSPELSSSLGEAITAMQSGKDATPALMRARRWLEGSRIKLDSLPVWTGAW
jgi:hypothetical protein